MNVRLGPIVIGVKNIEKSKSFYINVFGMVIKYQSENYLSGLFGDVHIEIEEHSKNRFPSWAKHNIGTYKNSQFIVSDINELLTLVINNGGKIVNGPKSRPWGSINVEIADPDNNIFLISQE